MDPLSHALLGTSATLQKANKTEHIKPAIICGIFAGMFPDLDILVRMPDNPMFGLSFHRHFSHSICFVPMGALVVTAFLSVTFLRKRLFKETYWFCFIAMACHGLLDAMTNYGTHLFLPFTERREAFSVISIIDPIFTGALLIGVVCSGITKNKLPSMVALAFALIYLSFGVVQHMTVKQNMYELAEKRGHRITQMAISPSIGNLFAWRGQYKHEGKMYVDAYHVSPWTTHQVYEGASYPLFVMSEEIRQKIGPVQTKDIEYFTFFADGWIAEYPKGSGIYGDMRYSTLPSGLHPLWGITFQPDQPDKHVSYISTRVRKEGDVKKLWGMIKGE